MLKRTQEINHRPARHLFVVTEMNYFGGGVDLFLNKDTALAVGLNLGKDLTSSQTQFGLQPGLKFFLSGRR